MENMLRERVSGHVCWGEGGALYSRRLLRVEIVFDVALLDLLPHGCEAVVRLDWQREPPAFEELERTRCVGSARILFGERQDLDGQSHRT